MKDERIDVYIEKSAEFAQPVLNHLREIIHQAVPEVHETMKWSFPHFEYKKSILCSMASFKQHCSFGFWLGSLINDTENVMKPVGETGMGQFGKIARIEDLPSQEIITQYIYQAVQLIESGAKLVKKSPIASKEIEIPTILKAALAKNDKAAASFQKFSPSHRKEYIQWIVEAKTETTREKRVATTIEWLAEGKSRNWKYEKC